MPIPINGNSNPREIVFNAAALGGANISLTRIVIDGTAFNAPIETVWESGSVGTWGDERGDIMVNGPILPVPHTDASEWPHPNYPYGAEYEIQLPSIVWNSSEKEYYRYDTSSPAWSDLEAFGLPSATYPTYRCSVQVPFYSSSGSPIGNRMIYINFNNGVLTLSQDAGNVITPAVSTTARGYFYA